MDKTPPKERGGIELDDLLTFVNRIVESFTKEGLDYAFTGAFAASYYGVPRTTADIDVLVSLTLEDTKIKLASALRQTGLEVDEKTIDDATTSGYRIASFKSKSSPYRIDIIFSDQVRKRSGNINGVDTFFQAPEDLISAKLRMIKATIQKQRAVKDEEDVKAILRFTKVDKEAIQKQAREDKTDDIWRRLRSC
jgi:hypothetical protein